MAKKRVIVEDKPIPVSELLVQIDKLGFHIHSYRNVAQDNFWLPALASSKHGYILWKEQGSTAYPFPHYTVKWLHSFGGAYRDLQGAVGWFNWLKAQEASLFKVLADSVELSPSDASFILNALDRLVAATPDTVIPENIERIRALLKAQP